MNRPEKIIIIGGLIALLIIPAAVLYRQNQHNAPEVVVDANAIPTPGAPGAQHMHAALVVNILGIQLDFSDPDRYMLQSKLVHFEDDNPIIVHKHTTGVTIPYFLSTLHIFQTKDCLDLQDREPPEKFCTNATNTLRMIVNGNEMTDPERYEIQNNDRILITYGPESGARLKLLYNQVPQVPTFSEITAGEAVQKPDPIIEP